MAGEARTVAAVSAGLGPVLALVEVDEFESCWFCWVV